MALTLGTNCGFVTVAPTTDPTGGATATVDDRVVVMGDTSPSTAAKIIEFGWWCNTASEEANFEVGLYAADGATVPGEAGTLLHVSRTNAKGTGSGWKVVTGLNWAISPSTVYWLAVQVDNVATITTTDRETTGGIGYDFITGQTTIPSPFGGGAYAGASNITAFYVVWEVASASGPANLKTYNTNAVANVKTINTNAISNVKSLNTNV